MKKKASAGDEGGSGERTRLEFCLGADNNATCDLPKDLGCEDTATENDASGGCLFQSSAAKGRKRSNQDQLDGDKGEERTRSGRQRRRCKVPKE